MLNATIEEIVEDYNNLFDNVLKLGKEEKYERYRLLCEDLSNGLACYTSFTNDKFHEILEGVLDIKLNEQQKRIMDKNKMFNNYYLDKIDKVKIENEEELEKIKEEYKEKTNIENLLEGKKIVACNFEDLVFKKINPNEYEVSMKIYFNYTLDEGDFEKHLINSSSNSFDFDR